MTDIQVRLYSRREAEEATDKFVSTGAAMRHMLLDLFERKAHIALGFTEFGDYATERLGGTWNPSYLENMRMWARVERDVSDNDTPKTLPQNIAVALAKLPAEKRAGAYEEALMLNGSGKGGLPDVKHIVTRLLNGDVPVGAVVDVRTGRPVADAPAPEMVRQMVTTFASPSDPEPVEEPAVQVEQPSETVAPVADVVFDSDGTVLFRVGAETYTQLSVLAKYYGFENEQYRIGKTVEKTVSQFYAIKKDRLAKYE